MELILASNSARRKEILENNKIKFIALDSKIAEKDTIPVKPHEFAMSLAFEKANAVSENHEKSFVLGADTVVCIDDMVLGKPIDRDEAGKFMLLLSGRVHSVITGISILNRDKGIKVIDCEISYVRFKELSNMDIEEYISTEEPFDKAGGYAIQGLASKFVQSYEGDYDNIVGLPTKKVLRYLTDFEYFQKKNSKPTIKDMPKNERPREKLKNDGVESLSNEALIAILLGTGHKEKTAIEVAGEILNNMNGLGGLGRATTHDLTYIKGVGEAKACYILAGIELGKRLIYLDSIPKICLSSPDTIYNLMSADMRYLKIEKFKILLLDTKNQLISKEEISVGGINTSVVDPRTVFEPALRKGANSIVLVHNHPSGNPVPSNEDIKITSRLVTAGKYLDLTIVDHIIIGDNNYYSFKENDLI